MFHEILLKQLELGSKDRPFVVVGVVRTEGPTAIKAGNKAIILSDGTIEGWVGGHCTEAEIIANAIGCLENGTSRMLNLSTCQGGRMDVYLEPYLPKRKIIICGHVPIVDALLHLAKMLNFSVSVVDKQASKERFPDADAVYQTFDELRANNRTPAETYAIVATMGERDQDHVEELSKMDIQYIGVVAGKKRASELLAFLRANNLPEERVSKIKAPAGIYIRAVTAQEIALSIMAEVVELARTVNKEHLLGLASMPSRKPIGAPDNNPEAAARSHGSEVFIDPVCGMTVYSSADFHSEVDGRTVLFCCEVCKKSFDSDPQKYVLIENR